MGKTLPAKIVFALSFEYISNDIIQMGKDNGREDVTVTDFHWALSVPAVWSDAAKQFMRLIAEEVYYLSSEMNTLAIFLHSIWFYEVICFHFEQYEKVKKCSSDLFLQLLMTNIYIYSL